MDMLRLSTALAAVIFMVTVTNVAGKTKIISPTQTHVYVKAGDTLTLTCEQEEKRTVEWLKDNAKIDDNAESGITIVSLVPEGRSVLRSNLTIDSPTISDSGTYVCQPDGDSNEGYNKPVTVFELAGNDGELKKDNNIKLNCTVRGLGSSTPTVHWYKGDNAIGENNKYKIAVNKPEEGAADPEFVYTLEIISASEEDAGEYECRIKLSPDEVFKTVVPVQSAPHVKHFEKSKNIVEDDPLTLRCKAWGHPSPSITWEYEGKPINMTDERVSLEANAEGQEDAVLRIQKLTNEDRGSYTCIATNGIGSANSTIFIRVKGRYAALWPFLGICAEVLILCTIIFIYEKKRSKSMEAEENREEADHLTNSHDHKGNDDIRQRK